MPVGVVMTGLVKVLLVRVSVPSRVTGNTIAVDPEAVTRPFPLTVSVGTVVPVPYVPGVKVFTVARVVTLPTLTWLTDRTTRDVSEPVTTAKPLRRVLSMPTAENQSPSDSSRRL
jgi:hypothetical protein